MHKEVKKYNLGLSREESYNLNKKALDFFEQANECLYSSKYEEAEKKINLYKNYINYNSFYSIDNRINKNPKVSIIIVSYNAREKLIECVDSVFSKNNPKDFEIIVVDNGENEEVLEKLLTYNILYIQNPMNLILSEGRNIGVKFSNAPTVAFLDDDAVVGDDYVLSIINKFDTYNIVGLRGRVLPKTENVNNNIASHYDLGSADRYVDFINTEGNSAFIKKTYLDLKGMNPLLFGHEGVEISHRIKNSFGGNKILYSPEVLIYHDFADNNKKLETKKTRHERMKKYLDYNINNLSKIKNNYLDVKFSIIMPTYNRKYCIKNAIDSLLSQTYQDFELIIVDDGSTDGTKKYAEEMYKNEILENKIKYIDLGEHKGVSCARNVGLKNAKNEWVGYLDTDNEMMKSFLEEFKEHIIDNPEHKIFYAQTKYNNEINCILGTEFDFFKLLRGNFIDNNVLVHKKDLYKELGGFNEKLDRLVDWDLVIRYTEKYKPFFIKKPLIKYNDGVNVDRITNSKSFEKNFKKIIIDYFNRIPDGNFVEFFLDNFTGEDKDNMNLINQIQTSNLQIKSITNSTSWKITKPLRFTADKIKRLTFLIKYSFVILKKEGVFSLIQRVIRFFGKKTKNLRFKA